ncbi:Diacylglycerol kinase family enzyme [Tropicimonas sediminicola]|uniref:Diacylglycerol kinase family enzyme n=2 Tax=Tropicimonas sediminicola TaxID=1031541 RepID=A0A239LYH3_9RHOB|nr:Diacylglycerol kinase family enzyme [Tropicimonas sediminicola]
MAANFPGGAAVMRPASDKVDRRSTRRVLAETGKGPVAAFPSEDSTATASLRTRRSCVILNDGAGRDAGGSARRERLARLLEAQGVTADLRRVTRGRDLEQTARDCLDEGYGRLIAAGGDGTIAALAGVVHGAGAELGILPEGTFNFFARGLGIPEDQEAAVAVLRDGIVREVPIGTVNGRVFLNNASLGVYPEILREREGMYRRWGRSRLAAYGSVFSVLAGRQRPLDLAIRIDGAEVHLRTALAFVCNSAYQLRQFGVDGSEAVERGEFVLLTSRNESRFAMLRAALRLALRRPRKAEDFDLRTGREIAIRPARRRNLLALDGERQALASPLQIRHAARPLRVIVPREASG